MLRALGRDSAPLDALLAELDPVRGHDAVLDDAIAGYEQMALAVRDEEAVWGARRVVEHLAVTLQVALLVRHSSPGPVADAFAASRLGAVHGATFGTLGGAVRPAVAEHVIERAAPA